VAPRGSSERRPLSAAEEANAAMGSAREASNAVTNAIGGLAQKSQQIGTIVQTITAIAEQTNLLALNAEALADLMSHFQTA
jgi:methyl-accepting chemotaxis protein